MHVQKIAMEDGSRKNWDREAERRTQLKDYLQSCEEEMLMTPTRRQERMRQVESLGAHLNSFIGKNYGNS